jgi:hypothetical protein
MGSSGDNNSPPQSPRAGSSQIAASATKTAGQGHKQNGQKTRSLPLESMMMVGLFLKL